MEDILSELQGYAESFVNEGSASIGPIEIDGDPLAISYIRVELTSLDYCMSVRLRRMAYEDATDPDRIFIGYFDSLDSFPDMFRYLHSLAVNEYKKIINGEKLWNEIKAAPIVDSVIQEVALFMSENNLGDNFACVSDRDLALWLEWFKSNKQRWTMESVQQFIDMGK